MLPKRSTHESAPISHADKSIDAPAAAAAALSARSMTPCATPSPLLPLPSLGLPNSVCDLPDPVSPIEITRELKPFTSRCAMESAMLSLTCACVQESGKAASQLNVLLPRWSGFCGLLRRTELPCSAMMEGPCSNARQRTMNSPVIVEALPPPKRSSSLLRAIKSGVTVSYRAICEAWMI